MINGLIDAGKGVNQLFLEDGAVFNTALNFTYLQVDGSAQLIGDNYISHTLIMPGSTLQLGNGGTAGSVGFSIDDEGTLAVDRADTITFEGEISGAGGLNQVGTGTTILSGANTYTGATQVLDGTLSVTGSLASVVSVRSGGMLVGAGQIAGLVVGSGGIVTTASALTALGVQGNVAFASGSTFVVQVAANGTSGIIAASGQASLTGGEVSVVAVGGGYKPLTSYTILMAAGGVTGKFDGVTIGRDYAFLTPSLSYNAQSVDLTLRRNDIQFSDVAAMANQASVAKSVQTAQSGSLYDAILAVDAASARSSFDALSGEIYASTTSLLIQQNAMLRDTLLRQRPQAEGIGLWGEAIGNWGQFNASSAGIAKLAVDEKGLATGLGYGLGPLTIGAAGGYVRSNADAVARASHADIRTTFLGGDASIRSGSLTATAGGTYSWYKIATNRTVALSDFSDVLHSRYHSHSVQGFGDVAFALVDHRQVTLKPFAGYSFVDLQSEGFAESGGSAAIAGKVVNRKMQFADVGLRLDARTAIPGTSAMFLPKLKLAWQHGWGDRNSVLTGGFDESVSNFEVGGQKVPRDQALIDGGAGVSIGRAAFGFSYLGTIGSGYAEHGARVSVAIIL